MKNAIVLFCLVIVVIFFYDACYYKQTKLPKAIVKDTIISTQDTAKTLSPNLFFNDYLPTSTYNEIIKHQYYTLSYSEKDEQAEWVAYKLTPEFLKNIKRTNNFRADSSVSTGSATLADYLKSGYDRGHLAPAASMSVNAISMSESFFMSNMSPQKPSFNRGIWKILETKVRDWVKTSDSLFVVSGPILNHPIDTIGINKVTVPRAYYKTILRFNKGTITGIAFLMPNAKSVETIDFFVARIDSIEMLTGIDFYRNLPFSIQTKIEANKDLKNGF